MSSIEGELAIKIIFIGPVTSRGAITFGKRL
jgi:hypothetical protein